MFKTDVLRYRVRLVYMYVNTYPKRRIYMKTDLEKRPVYVKNRRIEICGRRRHISKETYLYDNRYKYIYLYDN